MTKYTIRKFVKDWMLIIVMIAGVTLYLTYRSIPAIHCAGPALLWICRTVQPWLLFAMLFLSFCKIEPGQMRPHIWQLWLLLIQGGLFAGIAVLLIWSADAGGALAEWLRIQRIPVESAMLCLICPTATACAVVTGKLGGSMAGVVTYTVLINLLVAILVPLFVPLIYPQGGIDFFTAFSRILAKVFPLLIMPCVAAWLIRFLLPKLHAWLLKYVHVSFYIWTCALMLAIIMSTRAIFNSHVSLSVILSIALASLLACAFQFWAGKKIGARYGCSISAGQALGQKNTVFSIWMGYTFLDPIVSVAGGFYSIWHNVYNTLQLYRHRKLLDSMNLEEISSKKLLTPGDEIREGFPLEESVAKERKVDNLSEEV